LGCNRGISQDLSLLHKAYGFADSCFEITLLFADRLCAGHFCRTSEAQEVKIINFLFRIIFFRSTIKTNLVA